MLYLSGCVTQTLLANPRPDLGIMYQPGMGNDTKALQFWTFALDNGCFSQGERFDAGDWLEWLASLRRYRERCLFAVAPDVVGDATATWERSAPFLPTIRQLGFKAALVAQDGWDSSAIEWESLDCLFVGGTDEFKLSEQAYAAVREARLRGKWTHQGRCNSLRRLKAARANLFQSADGTYVKFGPDRNLPRVYDWLDEVNAGPTLNEVEVI